MTSKSSERHPLVELTPRAGWYELRLDRVDKRNALDDALLADLTSALETAHRAGAAVVVLAANGPTFCSGADTTTPNSPRDVDKFTRPLLDTPLFVIAQVEGPVLGIGLALLACSPLVIASSAAWGAMPEASRGWFPGAVAPYLESVGSPRQALTAALGAQRLPARALKEMGLVSEIVEPAAVADRATHWADRLNAPGLLAPQSSRIWRERFAEEGFLALKDRSISDLVRRFDEERGRADVRADDRSLTTGIRGAQ